MNIAAMQLHVLALHACTWFLLLQARHASGSWLGSVLFEDIPRVISALVVFAAEPPPVSLVS